MEGDEDGDGERVATHGGGYGGAFGAGRQLGIQLNVAYPPFVTLTR